MRFPTLVRRHLYIESGPWCDIIMSVCYTWIIKLWFAASLFNDTQNLVRLGSLTFILSMPCCSHTIHPKKHTHGLCCVMFWYWIVYPYPSGVLHLQWDNHATSKATFSMGKHHKKFGKISIGLMYKFLLSFMIISNATVYKTEPIFPNPRGTTVYPKKYAHGFSFAVLCCGYTLTDFPISIRLTSLALWQSNDCPSASKATLMNMDKYFMWIHYKGLHNHNKAKHNKTVCIFLGIYCNNISQTK